MQTCEFCFENLDAGRPANVAFLDHVADSPACEEQFGHLLANLRTSWTATMSGGA